MSTVTLHIKDETFAGKILNQISISLQNERTTVKDIIEARVRHEVDVYNKQASNVFNGLIQPTASEATLNGYKLRKKASVDAEKQVYTALTAFQKNGFFILIDNKQAETLEEEILVSPQTNISFVKLTPLVGG